MQGWKTQTRNGAAGEELCIEDKSEVDSWVTNTNNEVKEINTREFSIL